MNKEQLLLIKKVKSHSNNTQRTLAKQTGFSLGKVNRLVSLLQGNGYINTDLKLTAKGQQYVLNHHPKQAVILAAGYGMRMVPINMEEPKGLLEIHGEPLIERIIKQLHAKGINKIRIVVGFMKEHYEYLIDKYKVELVVNSHYSDWKNLYSLYLAREFLTDAYVIPCDIWFKDNPFSAVEDESWYLFSDATTDNSYWKINTKGKAIKLPKSHNGNRMVGLAYFNAQFAQKIKDQLIAAVQSGRMLDQFWERCLEEGKCFLLPGRLISNNDFAEINSYEQLWDLDSHSDNLQNDAIDVIEQVLGAKLAEIKNIRVLKKGMTNRSFIFLYKDKHYIMRIPGKGTDEIINRQHEYNVYQKINHLTWTEKVLYINPQNGYKLSSFIEESHNSDPHNWQQVAQSMTLLHKLHQSNLIVGHQFDLVEQINFYESLRKEPSAYRDYAETKQRVMALLPFVKRNIKKWTLCHIDANYDNFIFDSQDNIYLIDWEYAGMQDADVDIAMYAIYAMYKQNEVDKLIDIYYQNECDPTTRLKIYSYIALGGLLWSNWCEYKQSLGLDFGEYSLAQYRYAKEYSKIVLKQLKE